ncbi:hypothetical protein G4B88_000308 [Cannabis sativa]|uniref:Uncharacterized protein n=1 Tax=Cannabis sativa TaxID=3483 RepID=A0A7J6DVB2_CANSA|nr:hypothetical protein G4B88_000308 [Cannabis sativa]
MRRVVQMLEGVVEVSDPPCPSPSYYLSILSKSAGILNCQKKMESFQSANKEYRNEPSTKNKALSEMVTHCNSNLTPTKHYGISSQHHVVDHLDLCNELHFVLSAPNHLDLCILDLAFDSIQELGLIYEKVSKPFNHKRNNSLFHCHIALLLLFLLSSWFESGRSSTSSLVQNQKSLQCKSHLKSRAALPVDDNMFSMVPFFASSPISNISHSRTPNLVAFVIIENKPKLCQLNFGSFLHKITIIG